MSASSWLDRLNAIAFNWQTGSKSIHQLFEDASPPDLALPSASEPLIAQLTQDPRLIEAWQNYSYDKRGTPSPYLDRLTVGFYDDGAHDVVEHPSAAEACADFLNRETAWVLRRERRM